MSMDKSLGLKRLKKKTIKSIALAVIILSLILVVYQLVLVKMIEEYSRKSVFDHDTLKVEKFLNPSQSERAGFICHSSGVMISLSKLNDDYCDCPDGSDEPQTDACPNNQFQCHDHKHLVRIPSGRVNDGICDCCDGSDEWKRESSHIKQNMLISIIVKINCLFFFWYCYRQYLNSTKREIDDILSFYSFTEFEI